MDFNKKINLDLVNLSGDDLVNIVNVFEEFMKSQIFNAVQDINKVNKKRRISIAKNKRKRK